MRVHEPNSLRTYQTAILKSRPTHSGYKAIMSSHRQQRSDEPLYTAVSLRTVTYKKLLHTKIVVVSTHGYWQQAHLGTNHSRDKDHFIVTYCPCAYSIRERKRAGNRDLGKRERNEVQNASDSDILEPSPAVPPPVSMRGNQAASGGDAEW